MFFLILYQIFNPKCVFLVVEQHASSFGIKTYNPCPSPPMNFVSFWILIDQSLLQQWVIFEACNSTLIVFGIHVLVILAPHPPGTLSPPIPRFLWCVLLHTMHYASKGQLFCIQHPPTSSSFPTYFHNNMTLF